MSKLARTNAWFSIWSRPSKTIRAIVESNPNYGVLYLVAIFALQNLFFYANWWSLGAQISPYTILLASLFLSPFVGMAWVYFAGWIFYFTGRWLNGRASASHLRSALAWSKIPVLINLLMWLVFIVIDPKMVFVQDGGWLSSILVNSISLVSGIWSFILLIQCVRELQNFSTGRSIINILMGWVIYFLFVMIFIGLFRYIYLYRS